MGLTSNRKVIILTAINCYAYFAFGSASNFWGSALPDLEDRLDLDENPVKFGLAGRYVTYAISALISGFLFDRFNRTMILVISLITTAISLIVTPYWSGSAGFVLMQMLFGLASGIIDTASVVWCLELWENSR